jgi:hypothetical protein
MLHYLQDVPQFKELNISMKDNVRVFTYCIKDKNGSIIATSTGNTKKEAENNASKIALLYYNVNIQEYNSHI